jgi:hypothetical protein
MREQGLNVYRQRLYEQLRNEHAVNVVMQALKKWRVVDGTPEAMTAALIAQLDASDGEIRRLLESAFKRDVIRPVRQSVQAQIDTFVFGIADWMNQAAFDLNEAEADYAHDE